MTEVVAIDGATQPGYAGTPLFLVDGSNAGDRLDQNFAALNPGFAFRVVR